jgi:hypothetical protein
MRPLVLWGVLLAIVLSGAVGCSNADTGPVQKTGRSLDRAPSTVPPGRP